MTKLFSNFQLKCILCPLYHSACYNAINSSTMRPPRSSLMLSLCCLSTSTNCGWFCSMGTSNPALPHQSATPLPQYLVQRTKNLRFFCFLLDVSLNVQMVPQKPDLNISPIYRTRTMWKLQSPRTTKQFSIRCSSCFRILKELQILCYL